MMYLITALIFVSHCITLQCSEQATLPIDQTNEGKPLLADHLRHSDYVSLSIDGRPSPTPSHSESPSLISHINRINAFLKTTSEQEFSDDKTLFSNSKPCNRMGFANQALIAHARQKTTKLQTAQRSQLSVNPNTNTYLELLNDLVTLSTTHNKKQRNKVLGRIGITLLGGATVIGTSYLSKYI